MCRGSQKLRAGRASPRPGTRDSEARLGGEAEGCGRQPHPGGVTSLRQSWKEGLSRNPGLWCRDGKGLVQEALLGVAQ